MAAGPGTGLERPHQLPRLCCVPAQLMAHQGETCIGREAIMARHSAAAALHASMGGAAWRIRSVDSQPLGVVRGHRAADGLLQLYANILPAGRKAINVL